MRNYYNLLPPHWHYRVYPLLDLHCVYMCAAVPEIAHIRKTGQAVAAAAAPAEEGVYSGTVLLLLLWLFVPASSPCNYGSALEL